MGMIRKIEKSIRLRGVAGTAKFSSRVVLSRMQSWFNTAERRARAGAAHAEKEFDASYGIDTRGIIPVSNLDVKRTTWMEGNAYQGVGVDVDFADLLAKIVEYEEISSFNFVDLGSGKGRAVLLASRLPFHSIVGVEFSAELHRISINNLAHWPVQENIAESVSFVCADAAEYPLPAGPLVLFMYNPFGVSIMSQVADRVARHPARIIVVYFTPKHAELFDALPRLHRVEVRQGCVVWDSGD